MKKKKRTPFSPSKRIEELIRSTGLSPYGFSKITDISYSTLEGWINGDLNMFVSSLQDFCQAFGISEAHFWQEKMTDQELFSAAAGFWWQRMTVEERKQAIGWMKSMVSSRR